nr:unnamed protein product [Digitaria exilis]
MQEQHFPFIHCVEHLALTRKWDTWQSCFQETGLASQPVIDCYNSGYGRQDYMNFEAYICSVYDGELPQACKGKHLAIAQHTKASGGDKVCLVSKIIS